MRYRQLFSCMILLFLLCTAIYVPVAASSESSSEYNTSQSVKDLFQPETRQLTVNDISFHFPVSVSDFLSCGWEYTGDSSALITALQYSPSESFRLGELYIYALVVNEQPNPAAVSDCVISGFFIDQVQADDAPGTSIILPGNIQFGLSGKDQIISAYGQPSHQKQSDDALQLTYEYRSYQRLDLFISNETGLLNEIDFQNMPEYAEPDIAFDKPKSDHPSSDHFAYSSPTNLGSDLFSYNVDFFGDLYHLPAPVSAFLQNGWTLDAEKSNLYIAGHGFGWVYLQKDSLEYYAIAFNYNDSISDVKDCYLTSVEADTDVFPFSLLLPNQLTIGSAEADLQCILSGITYKTKTNSEQTEMVYSIEDSENAMNYFKFTVDTKTHVISAIEVSHIPELPGN